MISKEKMQEHATSALMTFGTAFLVDVYIATEGARYISDVEISWRSVLSAALITGARAVLRGIVRK